MLFASPLDIRRTGDDRPVDGLLRYVLRTSGLHPAGVCILAILVTFLSGFERIAGPVRGLLSLCRTAKQAAVQHRLIAEWM